MAKKFDCANIFLINSKPFPLAYVSARRVKYVGTENTCCAIFGNELHQQEHVHCLSKRTSKTRSCNQPTEEDVIEINIAMTKDGCKRRRIKTEQLVSGTPCISDASGS
uniref:uncharacterized protein LOC117606632 n=1 Tax=Osmia lignaria TaxID=473952 RepID=UPI0014792110|nr:uncharacterized protein LOC117606632 [Osmia lignaria]